jgi:hypothetical protein
LIVKFAGGVTEMKSSCKFGSASVWSVRLSRRTDKKTRDDMPAHNAEKAEAIFQDRIMAVEVYKSLAEGRSLYDAARFAWKANLRRAKKLDYVLGVKDREIVGVYAPTEWLSATPANFPNHPPTKPKRIGFVGDEAPSKIKARYLGRLVPVKKRGDQSEFHYHGGG